MRKLITLGGVLSILTACVVEEVTVDTGDGAVDDEVERTRPDPRDPSADEGDAPDPGLPDDEASDGAPYVDPAEVSPGDLVLAFVVADGTADLQQAVALDLYGEPDVDIATWAVRGADELAVSLQVAPSSPAGTLDVVVELGDGSIVRIPEGLTVR